MFEKLCSVFDEPKSILDQLPKVENSKHLKSLEDVQRYFPELIRCEAVTVKSLFSSNCSIENVPDELQDQFLELRHDCKARQMFSGKSLMQF